MTVEEHLTPRQIGERLGISSRRARDLFVPGKIWPVVRLNARVIRASASTVNRFLASRTWQPKAVVAET